jgi:hypothetical protein
MATEIDIEQSTQIAALEKDVELLRAEVAKYKDKEHQQFNNRINKLEKWVWGCSAVVAAVVTVGGILPKFINFGGGMGDLWWYAESNRKFLNEVVIPSLQKPGWESQFFKSWDKNGRWEQYN